MVPLRPGSSRCRPDGHADVCPLALSLTGGNRNDVTQLMPLLRGIPPVPGRRGRPRRRPEALHADRGYDHDKYRRRAWATGSNRSSPAGASRTPLAWVPIGG
jgi:hypothetical protein